MNPSQPQAKVLRLYPAPQQAMSLEGLYLELNLHREASAGDILIYANYIASLDGRISICDTETGRYCVPAAIANARDWRLYQELAAQADVLITSARYFRQWAEGRAQAALPIGDEYPDLAGWRRTEGLAIQPAVAIVSRSLDIPLDALAHFTGRAIYVFTVESADANRVTALRDAGVHVVAAGTTGVDGVVLRRELAALGFHSACMIAGPEVHATLLDAGVLDRLFLSQRHVLIGGRDFHTLLEGTASGPCRCQLLSLYYDTTGSQTFHQFSIQHA